ncbi:MAG: deoxyribonuclease IV [Candidatus Marinimicrobia bacterium]|nr:deoxyribonuclease IV [Candidatus Neomarinimicrobiota bacterium]
MGLIGCHVSISGGVEKSPTRGKNYGCDAMQIFTANQRRWEGKPITDEAAKEFKQELEKNQIKSVVTHDNYLINLAKPDKQKRQKSLDAFYREIMRSDKLGIPYIVFHPGSHLGKGEDYGLKQIAESIDIVLEKAEDTSPLLLLEITAGQGTNLGYTFEHLRTIIDLSDNPERLAVCYDTCHAHSAGYDITSKEKYNDTFKKFDEVIGLELLKVFHFNDTQKELGSKKDRHASLGEGILGWEPFRRIVCDERFKEVPMLLETPDQKKYKQEIATLKKFARET